MALSKIDTTNMIEDVPQSKLDNNINFRNIIINGDMSIAQRGTSATGLGNGDNGYHTCDRWEFRESGSPTWEFTQTQSTDVPTGQGFAKSLKMDCTTADTSLASNDLCRIQQSFEGQNLQYLKYGTSSAQSTTISFWVKSNKTGNYNVSLYNNDQVRTIGNTYTINSADTWEKKTITFAGDTASAFDNDNNTSLWIWWVLAAGTDRVGGDSSSWGAHTDNKNAAGQTVNLADSTSNEWYITGVQLEAGTTASDFEFLPRDINFERCARYFILIDTANSSSANTFVHNLGGVAGVSSVAFFPYENFVPFRSAPSVSQSAVITVDEYFVANRTQSSTSIAMNAPSSKSGGVIKLSNFSSMTQGNGVQLSSGGTISLSAEL